VSGTQSTPPADLPRLPARPRDGHKGTFGTVAVIGGCCAGEARMVGAPALAATAALRSGAGLAKLVMPGPILTAGLTICSSATGIPLEVVSHTGEIVPHLAAETLDRLFAHGGANTLAIGPGLGTSDGAHAATLRVIQQEEIAVVIDADALNCLAATPDLFRDLHAAAVLTPHPGEFKRLCAGLGLKNDLGLAQSRERACEQLAQRLGRIVVLKGVGTVVSDGLRTWTCPSGHPALATAGTGDVLTGLIAGLVAQYCPTPRHAVMRAKAPAMPTDPERPLDLYDASRVAVWAHGVAGETWAARHGAGGGLLAMELAELLPGVIESLRS
jgi:ADP-dependent NAD(P)H-hydrate dehydratase